MAKDEDDGELDDGNLRGTTGGDVSSAVPADDGECDNGGADDDDESTERDFLRPPFFLRTIFIVAVSVVVSESIGLELKLDVTSSLLSSFSLWSRSSSECLAGLVGVGVEGGDGGGLLSDNSTDEVDGDKCGGVVLTGETDLLVSVVLG